MLRLFSWLLIVLLVTEPAMVPMARAEVEGSLAGQNTKIVRKVIDQLLETLKKEELLASMNRGGATQSADASSPSVIHVNYNKAGLPTGVGVTGRGNAQPEVIKVNYNAQSLPRELIRNGKKFNIETEVAKVTSDLQEALKEIPQDQLKTTLSQKDQATDLTKQLWIRSARSGKQLLAKLREVFPELKQASSNAHPSVHSSIHSSIHSLKRIPSAIDSTELFYEIMTIAIGAVLLILIGYFIYFAIITIYAMAEAAILAVVTGFFVFQYYECFTHNHGSGDGPACLLDLFTPKT